MYATVVLGSTSVPADCTTSCCSVQHAAFAVDEHR
jgi:hypothetical protein